MSQPIDIVEIRRWSDRSLVLNVGRVLMEYASRCAMYRDWAGREPPTHNQPTAEDIARQLQAQIAAVQAKIARKEGARHP